MTSFLRTVRESGYDSLMGTGGNVYALRYMDYLLEAPLESSHFSATSYAIPFWGMVMHGSLQYAGKPYNEQANKAEAFLRAIESGASLYYLLSYDNTQLLKDTYKNDYYSVSYGITKDSMMADYQRLNALIGGMQNYIISDHRSVYAEQKKTAADIAAQQEELREEFYRQLVSTADLRVEEMKALLRDYITGKEESPSAFGSNAYPSNREDKKAVQAFIRQHLSAIRTYLGDAYPVDITDPTAYITDPQYQQIWTAFATAMPAADAVYGKKIAVSFDRDGVLASALDKTFTEALDDTYRARLTDFMDAREDATADFVLRIDSIEYESAYKYFTRSDGLSDAYVATWSTIDDHSVVIVTYSDGTNRVRFLLNFNQFAVNVRLDGRVYTLSKYGYEKLD